MDGNSKPPRMMSIREIAATGLLPEQALINYDRLCEALHGLTADVSTKEEQPW